MIQLLDVHFNCLTTQMLAVPSTYYCTIISKRHGPWLSDWLRAASCWLLTWADLNVVITTCSGLYDSIDKVNKACTEIDIVIGSLKVNCIHKFYFKKRKDKRNVSVIIATVCAKRAYLTAEIIQTSSLTFRCSHCSWECPIHDGFSSLLQAIWL